MMNRKAFTLVELLAVIALVAMIAIVVITPMVNQFQKVRTDLSKSQEALIYSAAETYVQKYKNSYPTKEGNKYCISLKMLVDEGLLQDNLTDQLTDAKIGLDKTIEVTVDSKVSYSFAMDIDKKICEVP